MRRAHGPRSTVNGFTLMEMLVALTVFSLIMAAVYSLFTTGRMAAELGKHHAQMDQSGRAALRAMIADLKGAWGTYSVSTFDTGFIGTHSGTDDSPEDSITLITINNTPPLATPVTSSSSTPSTTTTATTEMDLSKVTWSLDVDDETDALGLVRARHKLITETTVVTKKGEDLETIVPEVIGLRIRYYDGTAWGDTWDSTQSGTLPKAVEVIVTIKMTFRGTVETQKYSAKVYLPVAANVPKKEGM